MDTLLPPKIWIPCWIPPAWPTIRSSRYGQLCLLPSYPLRSAGFESYGRDARKNSIEIESQETSLCANLCSPNAALQRLRCASETITTLRKKKSHSWGFRHRVTRDNPSRGTAASICHKELADNIDQQQAIKQLSFSFGVEIYWCHQVLF